MIETDFSTIFILLAFAHFIADWLLQTDKMAVDKTKSVRIRALHCLIYTCSTVAVSYLFVEGAFLIVVAMWLFLTHFLIDGRKVVSWWLANVSPIPKDSPMYMPKAIVTDQIFHFLCFLPAIWFMLTV